MRMSAFSLVDITIKEILWRKTHVNGDELPLLFKRLFRIQYVICVGNSIKCFIAVMVWAVLERNYSDW